MIYGYERVSTKAQVRWSCESFYGTFKAEFIHKHRFSLDDELNNATIDYVYVYYNHVRPHSSNNDLTPFERRTQA